MKARLLHNSKGAEIELVRGGGGVFEISVDGVVKFSKSVSGHFPDNAEIDALVRN